MNSFKDLKRNLNLNNKNRILFGVVPMILTPRWFFASIQKEIEKAGGLRLAKEVYYRAGFKSAYKYCRTQRRAKRLIGTETIREYLDSMSIRGWGRFKIIQLNEEKGRGVFRLYHSALAEEYGPKGRAVCHWVPGAMAGAIQEAIHTQRLPLEVKGKEQKCKAKGYQYCEFVVFPK